MINTWTLSDEVVGKQENGSSAKKMKTISPSKLFNTQRSWVKMFRLQHLQTSNTGGVRSNAQGMHIEVAASSAACSDIASRDSKRLS